MTNLLQPADVSWFSGVKKSFKKEWMHWYMHDDKDLTLKGNTKSPGYVKVCKWLAEIWDRTDNIMIKKSFKICGIHKHDKVDGSFVGWFTFGS